MLRLLNVLVFAIAIIIILQSTAFYIPFGGVHRKVGYQSTTIYSQLNYQDDNTESITEDGHIFLRFSPLIGGPSFLPLHVEVIIIVNEDINNREKMIMDTVYIRRNNNLSATFLNKQQKLQFHRFDFLPERPTDPSTLARLSSLQGVPGNLRYRRYGTSSSIPNNNPDNEKTNQVDGKGITILLPIGSLTCNADNGISTAMQFKEKYSNTLFKELRIIGGKNCLQFALDLLSHIDTSTTGIQRVTKLNSLDIKWL